MVFVALSCDVDARQHLPHLGAIADGRVDDILAGEARDQAGRLAV